MSNIAITTDEWMAELRRVEGDRLQPVPPGWLSFLEVRQKLGGHCESYTFKKLRMMVAAGAVERKKFFTARCDGTAMVASYFYRLKKKSGKVRA